MPGAPRPSKLTPKTEARLVEAIRLGLTLRLACQYAGIYDGTLRRWLVKGAAQPNSRFGRLRAAIEAAEGDAAAALMASIRAAARPLKDADGKVIAAGDWRAAAWILERRHPQEYGRQVVEVQDGGAAPSIRDVSDADLEAAALLDAADVLRRQGDVEGAARLAERAGQGDADGAGGVH